ncbi:MAG: hypothetical protein IT260_14840 [Saprospiraceae bacterium]|nr:hypothetical protein [Saprospiraceae bacterium]
MKKYTLFAGFALLATLSFGQQTKQSWCGSKEFSPWLDWYQRNSGVFALADGDADTTWMYVPVTLHMIGTDAGTGYFPLDQAIRNLCQMNERYVPVHIRFYLKPGDAVQYHNNTDWYKHDWDGGSDMINTVVTAGMKNRLNMFVVADPAGACGYSWQDAVVLGLNNGCSKSDNTTWSHEAGHHLSLPHPFYGWEDYNWDFSKPAPKKVNGREVEKKNGSNCFTSGDRFCDTDPDYLSDRWNCGGNFKSLVVQHDPDTVAFQSDASLIMGYAEDQCASRFTVEQIAAMRANLKTEHSHYLQLANPLPELDDQVQVELISPVDTSENVQYNHIELKWNPVPGARFYAVEISNSPSFSAKFFNQTLVDQTSVTVTKNIPNNWKFYWRVRAYSEWDLCQPFDKAQIGIFRTQNLSATNELERDATFELAPNPVLAGTPAKLNVFSAGAMDISVKVCDLAGRVCAQQQVRLYSGENTIELDTNNLSSGAYSILIQNEKGATIKRLAVVE